MPGRSDSLFRFYFDLRPRQCSIPKSKTKIQNKEVTLELLVFLAVLLLLNIASCYWGVNSLEDIDDPEWDRRRAWRGFGAGTRGDPG